MEAVNGKLYAVGGRSVATGSVVAVNEMYDPATNTWSTRAPMPIARAAMASSVLHNQIQIWGGEGPSGTPTSTYPQGHQYDPEANTWISIAGEPTPRHGTDGATIGSAVYVPGGGPALGTSVTDVNEVFSFISAEAPSSCIPAGSDPAKTDSDGDGYTNQDETTNLTDPCSPASVPADNDGDRVSDQNDSDDDNDNIVDVGDQFQLDATNGTTTALPWVKNWNPGDAPAGKFGNTGFPGVQLTTHGTGFIQDNVHAGGAGGYTTLNATAGTNQGTTNSQDNALQIGFDARQAILISTRIADPFNGQTIEAGKSGGIFFGLDQDNYVKLALATDNGAGTTGLVFGVETNGNYVANPAITPVSLALPGPATVDLFLVLDPVTQRVTAQYRVDRDDTAGIVTIGSVDAQSFPGLSNFFKVGAATGILVTKTSATSSGLAYDYFRVEPTATAGNPVPSITGLSPASANAGAPAFTLVVNGVNFVNGATVQWNGTARATTFMSPNQLTAAIPAADVVAPGTATVTVVNPAPGGGTSNAQAFTITNCPAGQFRAEYYSNDGLTGAPTFERCESSVNYDWGWGGPGNGVGPDNFSARWTGRFTFASGSYSFQATADDGVRVFVDGVLIINGWKDQGPTTYTANQAMTAGEHEVKVEYYERGGGAVAQIGWQAN